MNDGASDWSHSKFLEAVRRRPAMFVGSTDCEGVLHLVLELVANAIDQFLSGKASEVAVRTDEGVVTVSDDGPGLDLSADGISRLIQPHWTNTKDGHAPHIHLVFRGVGLAAIVALCDSVEITSFWQSSSRIALFEDGYPVDSADSLPNSSKGTTVTIRPSRSIFSDPNPDMPELRTFLFQASHLFPGLKVSLNEETYLRGGLLDLAPLLAPRTTLERDETKFSDERVVQTERFRLRVALFGEAEVPICQSWANGSQTPLHGSHLDGVRKWLDWQGLKPAVVLVHVLLLEVEYAGPTRDRLAVDWLEEAIYEQLVASPRDQK